MPSKARNKPKASAGYGSGMKSSSGGMSYGKKYKRKKKAGTKMKKYT